MFRNRFRGLWLVAVASVLLGVAALFTVQDAEAAPKKGPPSRPAVGKASRPASVLHAKANLNQMGLPRPNRKANQPGLVTSKHPGTTIKPKLKKPGVLTHPKPPIPGKKGTKAPRLGKKGTQLRPPQPPPTGFSAAPSPDGSGMVVEEVAPGGFADQAGLEAGDTIMEVEGNPISSLADLENALGQFSATNGGSGTATLLVRDGKTGNTFSVPLQVP